MKKQDQNHKGYLFSAGGTGSGYVLMEMETLLSLSLGTEPEDKTAPPGDAIPLKEEQKSP